MTKWLHKEQNLDLKYEALLKMKEVQTNKEFAQLFGVPANTLFTWKNNKDKICQAFQQGSVTTKRVKAEYQVNKAVVKWFKRLRSKNVPLNGSLIEENGLRFARELNFESFQTSDG